MGSCPCPFVMQCHPCSGSCFHPLTAASWRVAGCKAAAQKRGVFCVSTQLSSQLPQSQLGCLWYCCGDEWIPGLQGGNSRLFLKTGRCGVDVFLGCCETALAGRLISELLACPARVLLLLSPAPAPRLVSRAVYLCAAELQSWTGCS